MTETPPYPAFRERLAQTRELADRAGAATGLLDELSEVSAHADRPLVRVAVAGCTARERNRLVNALVGDRVLPPGIGDDIPVLVIPGAYDTWETRTAQGWSVHSAPPTADPTASTDSVARAASDTGPGREVTAVRVSSTALAQTGLGLELISSPGGGEAPHSADAVILPVLATAAVTHSERAFLQDLLEHGLPADHILVGLTRTELVDHEEREDVVRYVHQRTRELSSELAVAVERTSSDNGEFLTEIRSWITGTVTTRPTNARARHVAHRLADCLDRIGELARAGEREAAEQRRRRAAEAETARVAHEARLRRFDHFREDVRAHRNAAYGRLRDERDRIRAALTKDLQHALYSSGNPRVWWTTELPHRLRNRLIAWNQSVRALLQPAAARELRDIDRKVHQAFDLHLRAPQPPESGFEEIEVAVPDDPGLTDLGKRRIVYRLAPSGAALVAALLVPGFGPVLALTASAVGTTLSEVRLRALVGEQRDAVGDKLPGIVREQVDSCAATVRSELQHLYQYMEDEVTRLREEWHTRQAPVPHAAPGPDWSGIAARTERLAAELLSEAGPVETKGTTR
ncbi:hypothetical protein [Nocardiopsis valliformis]|uniref:hypothetical protein n=1 Tax=Nocardiopsis valliformis TaxID=239974 RepID=UPI0003451972|nr:hypothetical protein [Nocardiopsis valliformis]